jgi:hypothetical protein
VLDVAHLAGVTAGADAQRAAGQRLIAVPIVDDARSGVDPVGARRGAEQVSALGEVLAPMTMP